MIRIFTRILTILVLAGIVACGTYALGQVVATLPILSNASAPGFQSNADPSIAANGVNQANVRQLNRPNRAGAPENRFKRASLTRGTVDLATNIVILAGIIAAGYAIQRRFIESHTRRASATRSDATQVASE
ncbi:MAG: hypothetical protein NVS2B7_29220 [Herpetosiphon sp.]